MVGLTYIKSSLALLGALLLQACTHSTNQALDFVGDKSRIVLIQTAEWSGDRSTGHSRSKYTLIETVTALRKDGIELEFDLPQDTSALERSREWHFPVRVFKKPSAPLEILNIKQLEDRIDAWLERWGIPPEQCGRWTFTWNAYKFECNPLSVLEALEPFDLRVDDVYDGALYKEQHALKAVRLTGEANETGSQIFIAKMAINPDSIRRERAKQALVTSEIMGEEKETLDAALKAQADDLISGTITTTFKMDQFGRKTERVRTTVIETTYSEDATTEREVFVETATRTTFSESD